MASRSVNKVILLGHLGSDADTRYTPNGVARTTFNLATNRYWKDAEGQPKEDTDWHNVVLWRTENLGSYLTKGKQVYIEGRLSTRNYDDQEGQRRYITEVIAEEVILLGGGANGKDSGKPQPGVAPAARAGAGKASASPAQNRGSSRTAAHPGPASRGSAGPRYEPDPEANAITDDDVPF